MTFILIAAIIIFATIIVVGFNYAASKVSGNHEDPYRDVGNGGCTEEDSKKQYRLERAERVTKMKGARALWAYENIRNPFTE